MEKALLHIGITDNGKFATLMTEKEVSPDSSFFSDGLDAVELAGYIKAIIREEGRSLIVVNGVGKKMRELIFGNDSSIAKQMIYPLSGVEYINFSQLAIPK